MTCYIIDDEQPAIEALLRHAGKIPDLHVMGASTDPIAALEVIKAQHPVDLVLLDIDMPNLSGLEMAELLPANTQTIFTTAYANYAFHAFEVNAVDFLLKPISFSKFAKAVNKAQNAMKIPVAHQPEDQPFSIFINPGVRGKVIQVPLNEILYVEGLKNYVLIYTTNGGKHITYLTMSEITAALPQSQFCRVHKSFVINLRKIQSIEGNTIYLIEHIEIPLGISYKEHFNEVIATFTVKSSRK
jgi:two-component system LytT family response regulator